MISLFQTNNLVLASVLSLIMRVESTNFMSGTPFLMGFNPQKVGTISLIRGQGMLKGRFLNPEKEHLGLIQANVLFNDMSFTINNIDKSKLLFYATIGKVILEKTGLPAL